MDDFFAELEAEIAVSLAATKLRSDRETARKKANTKTLPIAVRAAASEEYKAISKLLEAEEWSAVSTIALFTEQHCDGCGSTHRVFLQYMELQKQVRKDSTQRWVRVPRPSELLPRETLIQPTTTHICADCCEDHGFAIEGAERLLDRTETFVPSFNYVQEDINVTA